MASVDDVLNSFCSLIESVVYPSGINDESIAGCDISIFPGWPIPKDLDDCMKAGNVMVSVFPCEMESNVTRGLGEKWEDGIIDEESMTGVSSKETKRQEKPFMISVWASTPAKRAAVYPMVDCVLSDTDRIELPDSFGNMKYLKQQLLDNLEKEDVYRADLYYQVEFPTVRQETNPVVQSVEVNIKNEFGEVIATKTQGGN